MRDPQRHQWSSTFATRSAFLGSAPSAIARAAVVRFAEAGAKEVLELGPGQGRDTLALAAAGLKVTALDYAESGLDKIRANAAVAGTDHAIALVSGDVRNPLPFSDSSFDACYAHMLFCMALTTDDILGLAAEVRRVLRPGGLLTYTVRSKSDAHFQAGIDHGDDRWEMGGFVVHFFDRALVDRLARSWKLIDVAELEEGRLPRRLFAVTMQCPRSP